MLRGRVDATQAAVVHVGAGAAAALAGLILVWAPLAPFRPLLVLGAIGGVLLILPTEIFLAGCLLFTGAMQLADDLVVTVGPATLYASDGLLAAVAVRALWPKDRYPAYAFQPLTRLGIGLLGFIGLIGLLRAWQAGVPIVSALRSAQGFGYWVILYWGYSRLFRERLLNLGVTFRLSVLTGAALVLYLYLMTALNRPFEAPGESALGQVATSTGAILRRDYGFYSSFIFYPTLALLGMSVMLYARRNLLQWSALVLLGISATLTTLIRGQILGLAGGFVALMVVGRGSLTSWARSPHPSRVRLAVHVSVVAGSAALVLFSVNPGYALALVERAVPVLEQSQTAQQTAELRERALSSAFDFASEHPFGIGFLSLHALLSRGLNPELIEHSLPAAALYYLGWPGLIAICFTAVLLIRESRRAPAFAPWLHPFFVSTTIMMLLYGFGAVGLFRQPFVIGLGAYILSARFAAVGERR
jgi:hypothetical protein